MVSNAYVVRPVVENTLAVSDWVARRLRKAQLSSSIKNELRARTDKNLTFAMDDEWFDYRGDPPYIGGFAHDDFIVLKKWVHESADGMRQYAHEMTHRLANVTANVLGRTRDIGYVSQNMSVIYQKIANNIILSKDDIFTILFELGTDLHSVAANAIRSNPDLSAELLIAELRNTGYGQAFQQFYTAVLNRYRGTGKDDILVYLLEFAETSDARQFIQRLGSVREFQNFVAGTGSIYVQQGDAVVLMEFMKTQGIDLKRLVPIAVPVVTGAGLFGGVYYTTVNSSRPVGPQLNYANAISSGSPSPSSQRTVTNVFVNYNTLTGGGTDIMNVSSAQAFDLNRNDLCLASRAQNLLIGVKYSPPFADGADTRVFTIRFEMPEGSSVCSSFSRTPGVPDGLVPPSEGSMRAEVTVPGGSSVRLSWGVVSKASKYALRIDASPGYEANCQSPDICMDVSLPEYTFNFREGQPYRWWAHSVYEQPYRNPPQRWESDASVNKEFKFGTLELLDSTKSCSKYYWWNFPVRRKQDKLCFYHRTDCIDYNTYDLDPSCDFEHFVTKEDYSVKADYQSFFTPAETQPSNLPQFTKAECNNGVLDIQWKDGGPQFELRVAKDLSKDDVERVWGKEGSDRPNFAEGNDVKVNDLNQTSYSKDVGANNQFYTVWVHSKNQYGIGDAVYYPDPVKCEAPAGAIQKLVSIIDINNQNLDISGNSLSINLSSERETYIPIQIKYSNSGLTTQPTPPPAPPPPPSSQSNLPSFTSASCNNGVINISWTGSGSRYELRAGMNLTKDQIVDGTTWDNGHPNSNDLVGRNLTQTSFTKNVGANNQYYTIWIHSRNSSGVLSDRVFYPNQVYCR